MTVFITEVSEVPWVPRVFFTQFPIPVQPSNLVSLESWSVRPINLILK